MIAIVVWALALLVFAVLVGTNWTTVPLSYVYDNIDLPLSVVIICSVILGLVIGIFINLSQRAKQGAKIRQMAKRIEAAKKEITVLTNELEMHEELASDAANEQYRQSQPEDTISE